VVVLQVLDLLLVLQFGLAVLIIEVLFLRLDNHGQLVLFALYLLNQFFQVRNFFEVLNFLPSDLLVQYKLLLVTADLVLHAWIEAAFSTAYSVRSPAEFVLVAMGGTVGNEEWRQIAAF
jgi:hypothetical protein